MIICLDFPVQWEQYGGRQYCFVTTKSLAWDAAKVSTLVLITI